MPTNFSNRVDLAKSWVKGKSQSQSQKPMVNSVNMKNRLQNLALALSPSTKNTSDPHLLSTWVTSGNVHNILFFAGNKTIWQFFQVEHLECEKGKVLSFICGPTKKIEITRNFFWLRLQVNRFNTHDKNQKLTGHWK